MPLLAPDAPFERGVTEGPSLVKRGAWWYLAYSSGNCCGPPCTYVTSVARAPALLGPYEKPPRPALVGSDALRCPGHGTLLDLADGRLFFLHHGYEGTDVAEPPAAGHAQPRLRRRRGLADDGRATARRRTGADAPLGGEQGQQAERFTDDFRDRPGPGLAVGRARRAAGVRRRATGGSSSAAAVTR